ncbi:centrosomal protein of 55 kDa-like [Centruroides vittatus]|uniref:centrosomal protein of 55 kDa-like n=1 Tax=Centruroides vittatus TaxID=120091 RepID=UPI00350F4338
MCAEMNTSQVINEDCNLQSRTFDDNRCDSTELGRNLQITAATCTVMAEKLMKKSATKRNRKCISDPCEQSTEEINHRILELEEEILALKTENSKLRKIHLNEVKESNQETHSKCISGQEDKKNLVLRAENLKLRQLLKDVTEVNKRWQKYNHERQDHLQRLLEAIHEQHKQPVSHLLFNNEVPIKERRHMKLKAGCRHSDSQLEHVGEQSAIQQRYENAVKEICHLKKQLEESRQIQEAIIHQLELTRNEKKDEVLMLELQIKTYKEDWEAEKQERLVALEKINNLNEELNETKVELSNCKERLKQIEETSRGSSNLGKTFWQKLKPSAPSSSGIVNNFEFNLQERESKQYTNYSNAVLVADNPSEHRKSLSAPSSWEPVIIDEVNKCSLSDDDKNELECPGCKKTFPKNLHLEFLDHFEECQATSQIKK